MATKAYKYRLEPTNAQIKKFCAFAGQCRFVWNELLRRSDVARKSGTEFSRTSFGLSYEITRIKSDFQWLSECHIHCLQETARYLANSYQRFFSWSKTRKGRKYGPPKLKSRKSTRHSFSYKSGIKLSECQTKLFLPKIGWVKFRNSQNPVSQIKTATVKQTAAGHWNITVVVKTTIVHLPRTGRICGIDVGLSSFATIDNGESIEKVNAARFFRESERRLSQAQKALCRKKKGSKNRSKAKRRVAVLHERVANRRKDFQHKLSTKLVCENQAIGIETLCISGMAKTRLAKSVMDAGISSFIGMLKYKCEWYGRTLVEADRWYPSSKTCSSCGQINKNLELQHRSWECLGCGSFHDRDSNAATNLRNVAVGHTETENACGAGVSLFVQEGILR